MKYYRKQEKATCTLPSESDKITIEIIKRSKKERNNAFYIDKITDYKIIMKSAFIKEFGILKKILNNFFEVE